MMSFRRLLDDCLVQLHLLPVSPLMNIQKIFPLPMKSTRRTFNELVNFHQPSDLGRSFRHAAKKEGMGPTTCEANR